jgi:hypothetical protein
MADKQQDEKELRKREEKSAEEKEWDEKYRRDPLGSLVWPLILIWAGLVFLASNLGLFASFLDPARNLYGIGAWSIVMIGAGAIVLVIGLARLLRPEYRRPIGGNVIVGILLIAIGLGDLVNWALVWPLLLIALGAFILLRGVLK